MNSKVDVAIQRVIYQLPHRVCSATDLLKLKI